MSLLRFLSKRLLRSTSLPRPGRLQVEHLEGREVPAVDLLGIANSDFPTNKPLFVPITATAADGTVNYTVESDNTNVSAQIVTGGRSIEFTVSGKDAQNVEFSGSFTLRLFENVAPLATQNIIELVKNGYYVNKEFHRIVNDFVIQGGSPNGDGQGGSDTISDVRDEYNALYTFASRGIVAMANAGDDNNNAQFFITDPFIVDSGSGQEIDAPLDRRSQFLNFNHSVVGILTSGFDTYQRLMDVPKQLGSDGAISQPTTDVLITSAKLLDSDPNNAVVMLTALNGFLGSAGITVTGTDSADSDVESKSFTVTSVVDTVNDRPFLGAIGNVTTTANTPIDFTLPFTELDAGDVSTFAVGRVVNTANGPVFTTLDPTQGTATVDANGKVTVTPATGFTGTFQLTVGIRDAQDRIGSSLGLNDARNFDTEKINVTVGETTANTPPTISDIPNQTTPLGTPTGAITFTIGDAQTPAASLTLSVTTSNGTLIPSSNVVFGGSGASRTVTVTPVAGQSGTSTLTVTVRDAGNLTATDSFTVTVPADPNNTPPTISNIDNKTIDQNTSTGPIAFTVGDAETSLTALVVTVTSSNPTLVPESSIVLGGLGANRTLTVTPTVGQFGTAVLTVTVRDGGSLTASDTFNVIVTALPATITISSSATTATVDHPVLISATVTNPAGGSVQFLDGTTSLGTVAVVDGKAFLSTGFASASSHVITAKYTPSAGDTITSNLVTVNVQNGASPVIITAEGSAAGTQATVTIRNEDGSVRFTRNPYSSFSGLVRVKVSDINGDGQLDAIAVPGFGGGPHIVAYDGDTGELIYQRMIFENTFRGGLNLDVGDAKGLGYGQILVGAGDSGGPRVTLLDAKNDQVLLNYFAYDSASRGGVTVAISDLRGGNLPNIITGAGVGLAPSVNVYNPFQVVGFETPDLYGTFVATQSDSRGIRVDAGPLINNVRRDVLVGQVDLGDSLPLDQTYDPVALGVFVGP